MKWENGEIDGVVVRQAKKFIDKRGWLSEIFRTDEIAPGITPVMSYISVTNPGVSRGPHAHVDQTDMFAFMGPGNFSVKLWDNRPASSTYRKLMVVTAGEDNPAIVVVPPGVVHGYTNISAKDAYVLNLPNRLYAGEGKKSPVDEVRHENEANSEFVL